MTVQSILDGSNVMFLGNSFATSYETCFLAVEPDVRIAVIGSPGALPVETVAFYAFPEAHSKPPRTTNIVESPFARGPAAHRGGHALQAGPDATVLRFSLPSSRRRRLLLLPRAQGEPGLSRHLG